MISILFWLIPAMAVVFGTNQEASDSESLNPSYIVQMNDPSIDAQWKIIDSLENNGLYKSANDALAVLFTKINEKDHPFEMVKAFHYQAKYLTFLNEDEAAISTKFMEEKLLKATSPVKEMLYHGLATFYYNYLSNNWYQIKDRTPVERTAPGEFNNWTAEELLVISNKYFLASASNPELKAYPVSQLKSVIQAGNYADSLVTNLYELLLSEAIQHFSSPFTLLGEPVYAFSMDNPAYLQHYNTFRNLKITTEDTLSFTFRALQLHQTAANHFSSTKNQAALIYFDLQRLDYVKQYAAFEGKDSIYQSVLQAYKTEFSGIPSWTEIVHKLALIKVAEAAEYQPLNEETKIHRFKLQEAKKLCQEAIDAFPQSFGANLCRQLIAQIESSSFQVFFEQQSIPDQPILASVQFKNMKSLALKLVSIKPEQWESLQQMNYDKRIDFVNSLPTVRTMTQTLPDTEGDHQNHTVEFPVEPLPSGLYLMLAAEAGTESSPVYKNFELINVTGLTLITRQTSKNSTDLWVVDAHGGCGVLGAEVTVYRRDYSSGRSVNKKIHTAYTDKDGNVKINVDNSGNQLIEVRHKKDIILPLNHYGYFYENTRDRQYTQLFTDRSIYRPGQVVYFKGIALNFDPNNRPSIIPSKKMSVRLLDVNYQEVSRKSFVSNEFGSINGEFVLPVSGLTGSFTLEVTDDRSTRQILVEEYKRPRFEVTYDSIDGKVALGELIKVKGKATMLNGVPVDNASVRYRVVRRIRYPYVPWWYYRGFFPESPESQIAVGTANTDENGAFEIEFTASAPSNRSNNLIPVYTFEVIADVTDGAGETRQGINNIQISKLDRMPSVSVPSKSELDQWKKIHFDITNSQMVRQNVQGTLTVTRLESPDKYIKTRKWSRPDMFLLSEADFKKKFPHHPYKDEDNPASWKKLETVLTQTVNPTLSDTLAVDAGNWKPGMYEVKLVTQTSTGEPVEVIKLIELFNLKQKEPVSNVPIWTYTKPESNVPNTTVQFYLSTNLPGKRAFITVEKLGKVFLQKWVELDNMVRIDIPVTDADKGDIYVHTLIAGLNETHVSSTRIHVPWTEKQLKVEWITKRDKLLPGSQEEWTLKISGHQKDAVAAEALASMYDASLDLFTSHYWESIPFPSNSMKLGFNPLSNQYHRILELSSSRLDPEIGLYRVLPSLLSFGWEQQYYTLEYMRRGGGERMMMKDGDLSVEAAAPSAQANEVAADEAEGVPEVDKATQDPGMSPRTNLKETVFFFPSLKTDKDGNILLSFTMNEALTKWRFMLFAHTKDMATGQFESTVQTQKDLMVFPNVPRFVRQLDTIDLSMKISNLVETDITGQAKLKLIDEITGKDLSSWIQGNSDRSFSSKAGQSTSVFWKVAVPSDFNGALGLTYEARSGQHTDAEVHSIPVLTNRMMVTESMSLWVNGKSEKTFNWMSMQDKLKSPSLKHHQYTLEFTSNPAWYAVQAMPYIMEYPYDCTEQILSRYYANSLSASVLNKYPAIRKVFDNWASKDLLQSNLTKNQELKTALLAETPWVLNAQSEEQQQKNIALLFDLNRMKQEEASALKKLLDRQLGDGGFAWFNGGRSNWYVTQYLIETLGHMDKLGVKDIRAQGNVRNMLTRALAYCDAEFLKYYNEVQERIAKKQVKPEDNHLSNIIIHYLYSRTFFMDFPMSTEIRKATDFFLAQEEKYWMKQNDYSQGMIALTMHRNLNKKAAALITQSLNERTLYNEELGRYLKTPRGYFWYQAPIETHTMLMEVFAEIHPNDNKFISELRRWLLKQKQTTHWPTTKSTANAVYALLMTGDNWLEQQAPVQIQISGKNWDADAHSPVAGSGYVKTKLSPTEFTGANPSVKLNNPNSQPAWGAIYWQYFQDMDKITSFEETPLTLRKQVFKKVSTAKGPVLTEIKEGNALQVGDVLTIRIELKVDRQMEFLHMKDMRASGLEPMETLSSYRWKGGLGYYQSIKDTGVDFFFDFISPGTYIFEYDLRAFHSGSGSNGITTIQCMYAPEFTSHSKSIRIDISPK